MISEVQEQEKFDTSPDAYSSTLELQEGLDTDEVEEALQMAQFAKGGVMIISSPPRSGKDLLGHYFTWKLKRYFKNYRIIKDEKPRELFGDYTLFNREMVLNELVRMQTKATGGAPREVQKAKDDLKDFALVSKRSPKQLEEAERLSDLWLEAQKGILLQKGCLYVCEFWRYLHNRRPGDRFGIVLSGIMKQWGHLDLLVIGSAQLFHELDEYSCKPYVTWKVQARPSEHNDNPSMPTKFVYQIQKVQFLGHRHNKAILEPVGKPLWWGIDGGKKRPELGGKRYFDLFNSKSAPQMVSLTKEMKL